MNQTNVRIVRHRSGLKPFEVYAEYIASDGSNGAVARLAYARRMLADIQVEEPNMGWCLESRGTDASWHQWEVA